LDIFISYARKDLSRVEPIARALESLGYGVWWDADLRAGRRFHQDIERELAAARCVLVVWTQAAVPLGLEHDPGHRAGDAAVGPHSGPYGVAPGP